jgi:hypothetical protein
MAEADVPTPGSDQIEKPQTANAEQDPSPASTVHPEDKAKEPRAARTWKRPRYAGAAIGALALAVGLGFYVRLGTAGGPGHGWKPDAPLLDSHAHPEPDGKNASADEKERSMPLMRLIQLRRDAEDALILARFYDDERETDKLRKCLEALTRWKQEEIAIHGEPHFADADGLVITRTHEEAIEKDFWDRVTNAMARLSQRLH